MIKKKKAQEIQILREEYEQRLKVLQQEVLEEKRKKERLEEIWKESQYDEVYEERDGWNQWFEDPEEQDDGETREESKDSSFLLLSSPKDPKEKDEAEYLEVFKMMMESNKQTVQMVLNATTKDKSGNEADKLDQEDQRIKEADLEKLKGTYRRKCCNTLW